jgi:hypothetical protein
MSAELSSRDVADITSGIDDLRRSTRRTLPFFVIGLLATFLAAAVALYYIFSLSADLDAARRELLRTQATLATAEQNLVIARDALKRVNLADATRDNARQITAALFDLDRSQRDVTAASASVRSAGEKIAATSDATQSDATALGVAAPGWFAVVGSYGLDPAGLTRAQAMAGRARDAGLCAEVWQTKISRNYAVVVGGRTDRATAIAAAARARTTGLAADAFAQPDRDWTPLAGGNRCS